MELGNINELEILRETSVGLFLGDKDGNEVLLPQKFVPDDWEMDETLEVFVLRDSENRVVATTETPKILVNQFAFLKVIHNTRVGSFVNWGLDKDLLVPYGEQEQTFVEDESYVIYMHLDEKTDRLVGTNKFVKYLSEEIEDLRVNQEVDIIAWEENEVGMKVIINHMFRGIVYNDEIFEEFEVGDAKKAYVRRIREDGRVDITLKKMGYEHISVEADKIEAILRRNGGSLPLNDKSNPDDIYEALDMSKKSFKKAIGALYRARVITIESDGIKLN